MNTPSKTPRCYNRPPRTGYWLRTPRTDTYKPHFRWVCFRMSQDCGSWKTMNGLDTPVPLRENWNCHGCRLKPEGV